MRKILIVPAILALFSAAAAESRFFLSAEGNIIRPADENYRRIYGNQTVYPEFVAAVRFFKGLSLTGSFGKFSDSGSTQDLGYEASASQSYVSLGLGYLLRISPILCLQGEAGVAGLSFQEEALDTWIKGKKPGVRLGCGILLVPEGERYFVGLKLGYMSARVDDLDASVAGPQTVRLGGTKLAICFGIRLFDDE
jgi:hypothetical protein